jgi:hypothetical protein
MPTQGPSAGLANRSTLWRTKNRNRLSLISSKNLEVSSINSDDGMSWEQLAHSHEAQVGKIRLLVRISIRHAFKLNKVLAAVKRERDQSLIDHRQGNCGTAQVECSLSENSLASQKRFGDSNRNLSRPLVVFIVGVRKCHQESGVSDTLHEREKPLRAERSLAPCTVPASLINEGAFPPFRALSSCSRTMRPLGIPDCFDAWSSHDAKSSVSRIVIVLLICH